MAGAKFYLKNPREKGETLIYLYFRYQNQTLKYSTGLKVPPSRWDGKRIKGTDHTEENDYLSELKRDFEKVYIKLLRDKKEINNDTIREAIEKEYQASKGNPKPKTFFNYLEDFIESRNGLLKERTIFKFEGLQNHLKDFQKVYPHKITFARIDQSFYEKFLTYLQTEKKQLNNTTGKYISSLKTFLAWATDKGHNTSLHFQKFKAFHEDSDIVYLTEEELLKLYNFNLTKNPRLREVRETFCFGCFTGLRYSDIARLTKEAIKGDHLILNTQKTKDRLVIPLSNYAKEILKRNNYSLPVISNQKTNDYLKELGMKAKIDDPIMVVKYRGSEEVRTSAPKYQFLTSHTARRTFVTLSLEKGMRAETLMSITGHKSYKTFKKYIKITDKVKTNELQRIWNSPKMKVA